LPKIGAPNIWQPMLLPMSPMPGAGPPMEVEL